MQVTDAMVDAAAERERYLAAPGRRPLSRLALRAILQAALDAMPKATGGLIPGPGPITPQPADVTPPQKVHDAADNLPGLTFNLNQQYGGLDEAAAKKLRLNVGLGDARPQAADG